MFLAQTTKKDIVEITTTIFLKSLWPQNLLEFKIFYGILNKIVTYVAK